MVGLDIAVTFLEYSVNTDLFPTVWDFISLCSEVWKISVMAGVMADNINTSLDISMNIIFVSEDTKNIWLSSEV